MSLRGSSAGWLASEAPSSSQRSADSQTTGLHYWPARREVAPSLSTCFPARRAWQVPSPSIRDQDRPGGGTWRPNAPSPVCLLRLAKSVLCLVRPRTADPISKHLLPTLSPISMCTQDPLYRVAACSGHCHRRHGGATHDLRANGCTLP